MTYTAISAAQLLLAVAAALLCLQHAGSAAALASPAVAPAPSGKTSACALPSGAVILAPEASGTSQQYLAYYYKFDWGYYSYYYEYYYVIGRKLLQSATAPSPTTATPCCAPTATRQGDTVSGLISSAGLPADSKVFFYALNPAVKNGTDSLPAGIDVTVPCFRITEFNRMHASAAPAPAIGRQ